MGMDVTFGTIWGLPLHELVEDLKPIYRNRTRYDVDTGEKKDTPYIVHRVHVLHDFGQFKSGTDVDELDVETYLNTLRKKHRTGVYGSHYNFYVSYSYVGFRSFGGDVPYSFPQDMYRDYEDTSESARLLWDTEFPGVPGRNLLFLYVSS